MKSPSPIVKNSNLSLRRCQECSGGQGNEPCGPALSAPMAINTQSGRIFPFGRATITKTARPEYRRPTKVPDIQGGELEIIGRRPQLRGEFPLGFFRPLPHERGLVSEGICLGEGEGRCGAIFAEGFGRFQGRLGKSRERNAACLKERPRYV